MAHRLTGDLCIGIDVGGTFTDAVLTDGVNIWRAKSPTTLDDVGRGLVEACRLAAQRAGQTFEEMVPSVRRFGIGTTAVTNVLASRKGRRVGLITTKGFEDLIPLNRQRQLNDDRWLVPTVEIIPRRRIAGVAERIDRDGEIVQPLDVGEVVEAARHLIDDEGAEVIVISFLWSFRNSAHEDMAVRAVTEAFPGMTVMSGVALYPVIREFERTTFALLNAYTSGAFSDIDDLATDLKRHGLQVPLLLVHSGGGSITTDEARRVPIGLAESGPAAGVAAAAALAQATGYSDVITCDLGGTSFDVAVVSDGDILRRTRGELMGVWTALSFVDVESIGAGGGSVGWVDARGILRVGPQSAGAVPGPACYGRGGSEPTVTDALVVLGYIDPDRFLGGEMKLDADQARSACARAGAELGTDAEETAWGIREIALAGMIKAVRSRLAARGLDPRTHAILSYGGCGALFTPDIALATGSPVVIVPELASVLSALGAATANVRRERARSVVLPMPFDPVAVNKICSELRSEVDEDLAGDAIAEADRSVVFEADLRFRRQMWEISIPLSDGLIDDDSLDALVQDFRTEYAKRYGQGSILLGVPIELATIRAIGVGRTPGTIVGAGREPSADDAPATPDGTRRVRLGRDEASAGDIDHYSGPDLKPGHQIAGPALIDHVDTTIWIPPGTRARVDRRGTLLIEVGK